MPKPCHKTSRAIPGPDQVETPIYTLKEKTIKFLNSNYRNPRNIENIYPIPWKTIEFSRNLHYTS